MNFYYSHFRCFPGLSCLCVKNGLTYRSTIMLLNLLTFSKGKFFPVYFFERQMEKNGLKSFMYYFIPAIARTGWGQSWDLETESPTSLPQWQGPTSLTHICCLLREQEAGSEAEKLGLIRHCDVWCRHPRCRLNHCNTVGPQENA